MYKSIIIMILLFSCFLPAYALNRELSKPAIVAAAVDALQKQGFDVRGAQVIYDENNRLWRERVNKMKDLVDSPNFKLFEVGFMRNYRTVYFGFIDPPGEVWVFVDKDTGEVLDIYRPNFK